MIKRKFTLLAAIGIISALLWRVEIELHGWAGLNWIGYFYWVIPIGITLFLGWLFMFTPSLNKIKRGILTLITAIVSIIWFLVIQFALVYHFNPGPSAFAQLLITGERLYQVYKDLIYVLIPLTPLLFAMLLFTFGLKSKLSQLALAVLVYILACPVSVGILALLHHEGGADALHTIKSGIIIPFLVFGLGVLVPNNEDEQQTLANSVLKPVSNE